MIRVENVTTTTCVPNITVSIFLNNTEDVSGFQFDLAFPSFLVYEDYHLESRASNATLVVNGGDNLLRVASVIIENISTGSEIFMNFTFSNISQSSPQGNYALSLSNVIIGNIKAQTLSVESVDGVFTLYTDNDCDDIIDDEDTCPNTAGCSQYDGCSYGLKEWLPPITNEEIFELQEGATLPYKFNATDCDDIFYNDSEVKVRVYNTTLGIDKTYNASGEGSDYVRIEIEDQLYITNIHTGELEMPVGGYDIKTTFSNNYNRIIGFELVEKGSQGKGKGTGPKN